MHLQLANARLPPASDLLDFVQHPNASPSRSTVDNLSLSPCKTGRTGVELEKASRLPMPRMRAVYAPCSVSEITGPRSLSMVERLEQLFGKSIDCHDGEPLVDPLSSRKTYLKPSLLAVTPAIIDATLAIRDGTSHPRATDVASDPRVFQGAYEFAGGGS